ncbi:hypothetical protein KCV87_24160 [Actinosynnema pretiosum subsp. pretiosum]|uniref:Uncharacterized protein n=1 Tax=Actinosynnema pretiosum subsp. pretiosum TaxID=103721 RepID=A0AA45L3F3_9PSEU|nr:hypothetical protein KCV87_24160 [Actinosynnema pretiosum subsp. pretiosum]
MSKSGKMPTKSTISEPGRHWLLDWMEEFEVPNGAVAVERMKFPRALQKLYELAQSDQANVMMYANTHVDNAVVGGNGFEIGARGNLCAHPECRINSVNNEVVQALHYFDSLVVEGPSSDKYTNFFDYAPQDISSQEYIEESLTWDVDTLVYVQSSGIANFTRFLKKPNAFCDEHFTVHAKDLGMEHLATRQEVRELARRIAREGTVRIAAADDELWNYTIEHPLMGNVNDVYLQGNSAPPKYMAVEKFLRSELTIMVSDFATAKALETPLAVAIRPAILTGSKEKKDTSIGEVAAHLKLPFLTGLSASDFTRLRSEHWDDFLKFRAALTAAIRETLKDEKTGSPDRIAAQIQRDFIEPALAEIARKVRSNTRSTVFKSIAGVTVGSAVAAFGALTAMPLLITAGVTAAATPLVQAYKYFDEKRDIELSDMYFLWRSTSLASR